MRACAIQLDSTPGNVEENLKNIKAYVEKAKQQGARLVLLPELIDVSYDLDLVMAMDYDTEITVDYLKKLAKENDVYMIVGLYERSPMGKYNTAYVFSPNGEVISKYRKNKLFCLSKEKEAFQPGDELCTVEIEGIRFGIMICYDIRFPELARSYVDKGCEALAIISAFPFPRVAHWNILLRARAIEDQMYVVAANRVGKEAGVWFHGKSCIIDPWGTTLQEGNETEQQLVMADLDAARVKEVRNQLPALLDR